MFVEEIDSDDEFDIETANGGTYYKRSGTGFGHTPKPSIGLDFVIAKPNGAARPGRNDRGYSSSNRHSPPGTGRDIPGVTGRKNSTLSSRERERDAAEQAANLLSASSTLNSDDEDAVDLDLPPAAPRRKPSPLPGGDMGQQQGRPGPSVVDDDISSHGDGDVGTKPIPPESEYSGSFGRRGDGPYRLVQSAG